MQPRNIDVRSRPWTYVPIFCCSTTTGISTSRRRVAWNKSGCSRSRHDQRHYAWAGAPGSAAIRARLGESRSFHRFQCARSQNVSLSGRQGPTTMPPGRSTCTNRPPASGVIRCDWGLPPARAPLPRRSRPERTGSCRDRSILTGTNRPTGPAQQCPESSGKFRLSPAPLKRPGAMLSHNRLRDLTRSCTVPSLNNSGLAGAGIDIEQRGFFFRSGF